MTHLMIIRCFFVVGFAIPILFLSSCTNSFPVSTSDRNVRYTSSYSGRFYRVAKGETLYSIAWRTGHHYLELAVWNKIQAPYTIFPGQKIQLFAPKISNKLHKKQSIIISRRKPPKSKASTKPAAVKKTPKKILKIQWKWPLTGTIVKNFSQTGRKGIEIVGKLGQAVRAAAKGKVVYSGQGFIGYGNLIIIKHNEHFLSAYANNRTLLVREGELVRKGQKIGEVGTVTVKKPLLHFEIRKNGKPVNPMSYLPKHY